MKIHETDTKFQGKADFPGESTWYNVLDFLLLYYFIIQSVSKQNVISNVVMLPVTIPGMTERGNSLKNISNLYLQQICFDYLILTESVS